MIFYQVPGTSVAPCCLVGTQVDAKRLARERGTSWEQVNVPTDKEGLMAYVNQLKADVHAEIHRGSAEAVDSFNRGMEAADANPLPPVLADERDNDRQVKQAQVTVQSIEEFILDQATTSQVESIFACLGTRFKEAIR